MGDRMNMNIKNALENGYGLLPQLRRKSNRQKKDQLSMLKGHRHQSCAELTALDPAVDSIRQIREALPVKEVPESHVS